LSKKIKEVKEEGLKFPPIDGSFNDNIWVDLDIEKDDVPTMRPDGDLKFPPLTPIRRGAHNGVLLKVKKLDKTAVIPKYSKSGDAGLDLTATSRIINRGDNNIEYGTGLAVEIPSGHVGLLFPRSSNAKYDLLQTNSVGIIDSGYRGEVIVKFKQTTTDPKIYEIGDRIGQLVIIPYPQVDIIEVNELSDSDRGTGGFGSTGV
jgi:dUTP pyrophosphatase